MNFVVLTEPFFRLPAIAVAATGFFLLVFAVAFATGNISEGEKGLLGLLASRRLCRLARLLRGFSSGVQRDGDRLLARLARLDLSPNVATDRGLA
jgi:hypothetical protein